MKTLKSLFIAAVIFAFSYTASAQKLIDSADGYRMTLKLDRPDAIYNVGEEIKAEVSMTINDEPFEGEIRWKTAKDNYKPSERHGVTSLEDGKAFITCSLDEPGIIHIVCTFKTPQGNTIAQMVGAAVDPYRIERSMPVPADFNKYWKKQLKKQSDIPMNIRLKEVNCGYSGLKAFDIQADCAAGNFSGYLVLPENAQPKSLPAMVLCHGAGVAASRLKIAAEWAKEGIIVLDFNVHGLPNDKPREWYRDLGKNELKEYWLYDTSDRDRLFFRKMIFRLMRAFEIVTERQEWDGERLIAFGRSQGGAQALIAGGLDPRIKLVCAEIPALCDVTGYAAKRAAGWPRWPIIDKSGNITDEKALNAIRYVDVINFVPQMKAKCYMTVGYIDVSCPATGVFAVYNEIPTEKHLLHNTKTGHRVTPEGDAFVRQAVLDYIN